MADTYSGSKKTQRQENELLLSDQGDGFSHARVTMMLTKPNLEDNLHIGPGAAGSFTTIDAPASATISE